MIGGIICSLVDDFDGGFMEEKDIWFGESQKWRGKGLGLLHSLDT